MSSTSSPWSPTPDMIPPILDLREKLTSNKRFIVAWLGVVWFDTLATLPDERILWASRLSMLKGFFLLNRWLSPLAQSLWAALVFATIPADACAKLFWLQPASITLVMVLSGILMAIRVYALYSTRKILAVLVTLVLFEVIAMSVAASRFHALQLPPVFGKIVDLEGCIATGPGGHADSAIAVFWAAPLCFDSVILLLTIYNILVVNKRARRLPVLSHILRDGVTFFIVISVANLINVALYAQKDIVIQNFNNPTSVALASIMASRLVTSLRNLDRSQNSFDSRVSTTTRTLTPWTPPLPSHSRRDVSDEGRSAGPSDLSQGGIEPDMAVAASGGLTRSFSTSSGAPAIAALRARRPNRSRNQAMVGLERLGLISPSTAVDISRPMPFGPPVRAPFSDVINLETLHHDGEKGFFHFPRSTNHHNSTRSKPVAVEGALTEGEREGGGGFGITVERETVVTVAAQD